MDSGGNQMQATTTDRRTAIKIALIGTGAMLLPPIAVSSAECATTIEVPQQSSVPPCMCAELHIEDLPEAPISAANA